jgi:hypothetical protein
MQVFPSLAKLRSDDGVEFSDPFRFCRKRIIFLFLAACAYLEVISINQCKIEKFPREEATADHCNGLACPGIVYKSTP